MEKEISRLLEDAAYSDTVPLLTYHSVFELTEKGYTLLKHRELLTCVIFCNSFETAWFLRECQPWLLIDTPTQRQNGFTRSVDKVHSYHFVADDHYNVAHAQTSDRCVSVVSPLCLRCVSAVAAVATLSKTPANRTLALGLVAQRERSQTIWRLKYVNNKRKRIFFGGKLEIEALSLAAFCVVDVVI